MKPLNTIKKEKVEKNMPRIVYKKWWHRFLPYYRKRIKLMNVMLAHEWENGLEGEIARMHRELMINGFYILPPLKK